MFKGFMFKRFLTALSPAFVVTVLALASPAMAERPSERITFTDVFSDEDPGFAADCGIDRVDVEGTIKVQLNFFDDGSARIHDQGVITFTNPDTGGQLILSGGRTLRETPAIDTIDGDLMTVEFQTDYVGLAEKWQAPGLGVIVRDAGSLTIRTTVVIDLAIDPDVADPVVSFTEEIVDEAGPHPIAESGFDFTDEQQAAFCQALDGSR